MKIKYMLLALMPLCIASCSEEETYTPDANQQEVRVTAGIGTHSRMVLSDQGEYTKSLWQSGDAISLFTSTQSNLVYSTTLDANSASASFSPSIVANQTEKLQYIEGNTVYACYPNTTATTESNQIVNLPSTEDIDYNNGKLNSFCYAVDNITNGSLNFKFKHLSAFLCLTVTPEMVPVGNSINVTVSTSSNAPLSIGEGDTFDFSTLTATTTHGTNSVKITAHSNDSIWTIYIPVLPQPANADITITVTNSHDELLYTMTKETPASGFQAGNVYKVGTTVSYDVAYLVDGPTFNASIKQLADGSGSIYSNNYSIAKVEFLTEVETLPEQYITVSANNSPVPIYASFNPTDSLLTVFTPAKNIETVDATYMFISLPSLRTIDLDNFKVNETTINMNGMFIGCSALTSLNVSNWNTENVTNINGMFADCSSLTSLDVSNWDTKNVTNMSGAFSSCFVLTSLDVSNWDTKNVTDMKSMFAFCSELTSLDVSRWNTGNVTDMSHMFKSCDALTSIDLSNWNTENVTDMSEMFWNCYALTSLDVSNWDTKNVTKMSGVFGVCSALTSLDVSNWKTEKVQYMNSMFDGCSALTSLDVSNWNTDNVTEIGLMFYGCSALTSLDVSNWNTKNVTDMGGVFSGCSALTSLDVSNWNTAKATYMNAMFSGCSTLTSLDVSNWDLSNVYSIGSMFAECSALKSLDVSNWDTTNMNYIGGIFSGCSALTSLDLSNWNTAKVTEMYTMFENCSALTSLDLSNWDTAKVTEMFSMFENCSALTSLDLSNWNTAKVFRMSGMFSGCSALTSLNLSNWKFYGNINANIENYIAHMFYNCASTSKACKITTTQEAKDFLLARTSDTRMTPDWFIWGDTGNNGSGFEEMPKEEW